MITEERNSSLFFYMEQVEIPRSYLLEKEIPNALPVDIAYAKESLIKIVTDKLL